MARRPSDWAHLWRLTLLFVVAAGAFALVRPAFRPDTFGDIGHFRASALVQAQERETAHAGRGACVTCHVDIADAQTKAASKHQRLSCESCHGALAAHANGSTPEAPVRPDATMLCRRCHEVTAGRPAIVPQVVIADHSGEERCVTCHNPHAPGM